MEWEEERRGEEEERIEEGRGEWREGREKRGEAETQTCNWNDLTGMKEEQSEERRGERRDERGER
jgi:hypothetical protein